MVSGVADGLLTKDEIKSKMNKLRGEEESIQGRLREVQMGLVNIPDPEQVKRLISFTGKMTISIIKSSMKNRPGMLLLKRDFEWKRELVQHAFSGADIVDKALGIYVDHDENGNIIYEIKGRFETTAKSLTLTKEELIIAFGLDPEYHNIDSDIDRYKRNIAGIHRSMEHPAQGAPPDHIAGPGEN